MARAAVANKPAAKGRAKNPPVTKPAAGRRFQAPATVSRRELLVDGSDGDFRRLVHGLFGFLARHEAVRAGHAAHIGLAGIEYTALISISHLGAREGNVSVGRIAEHLHLSGAFVTTITNKLLKKRLIHKGTDPEDRRRVRLEVSEEGWRRLAELSPVQREVNDVQFDCLSAAEFRQLLELVERLIDSSDRALRLQAYLGSGTPEESRRAPAKPPEASRAKRS